MALHTAAILSAGLYRKANSHVEARKTRNKGAAAPNGVAA